MNLDKIKEEISSLVNKEVMINISGSRNKKQMY